MLVQKGKGLEVNTAGFKHYSKAAPSSSGYFKMVPELGGEIITIDRCTFCQIWDMKPRTLEHPVCRI